VTGIAQIRYLHPCSFGEVQEWLNWQHWKCCVRGTVPWVRIPPSPPEIPPEIKRNDEGGAINAELRTTSSFIVSPSSFLFIPLMEQIQYEK
jgi:hypothetical protein